MAGALRELGATSNGDGAENLGDDDFGDEETARLAYALATAEAAVGEHRFVAAELLANRDQSGAWTDLCIAALLADLRRLASCREAAMSTSRGLMDRLKLGQIVLDEQRQALRAKLALDTWCGIPLFINRLISCSLILCHELYCILRHHAVSSSSS